MRPVLAGDIFALARCLQQMPGQDRMRLCRQLLIQAEFADKYRKKFKVLHPDWGNGSLMSRALMECVSNGASAGFQSRDFCACTRMALEELEEWRRFKHNQSR